MGSGRAKLYGKVWDVLHALQEVNEKEERPVPERDHQSSIPGASMANAFGGVLVDDLGRVLLREPRNHFDGYVWTFAKGKIEKGATPEQTALREVLEETGYDAEIVAKIPGGYRGGTGTTEYFLMKPIGQPGKFQGSETANIQWVTFEEAERLISLTSNNLGRLRDLKILQAAQTSIDRLESKR
ncbi:MAG: NUDIX hydrolase [Proteobacteria bacterium]|nr:NUDIX hydrolase [Pseudomonadota bacterium]